MILIRPSGLWLRECLVEQFGVGHQNEELPRDTTICGAPGCGPVEPGPPFYKAEDSDAGAVFGSDDGRAGDAGVELSFRGFRPAL